VEAGSARRGRAGRDGDEAEEKDAQAEAQIIGPRRPVRARITGPGSDTDPELMQRLQHQVIGGANDEVLELLAQHDGGTSE